MLNTALIGCGRISHKHIEAFAKNAARMHLVAVCDPKEDRADAMIVTTKATIRGRRGHRRRYRKVPSLVVGIDFGGVVKDNIG